MVGKKNKKIQVVNNMAREFETNGDFYFVPPALPVKAFALNPSVKG